MYHQHILDIPSARAELALQTLINKYENGEIKTQDELMSSIVDAYLSMVSSSSEPTVAPCSNEFGSYLFTAILTKPFAQVADDLDLSYRQLARLKDAIINLSNLQTSERLGLSQTLKEVKTKVDAIRAINSDLTVVETFTSNSQLDMTQTSASINNGVATLTITNNESLNSRVESITVDYPFRNAQYVQGLPGNNLEILTSPQESVNIITSVPNLDKQVSDVVFAGSNQVSSSKVSSLLDSNPGTWFELESYFVPEVQPLRKQGESYIYANDGSGKNMPVFGSMNSATLDQGWERLLTWPGEAQGSKHWIVVPHAGKKPGAENSLTMTLVFSFDSPVPLSWIELIPMLEKMGTCNLASVQVSADGSTGWQELLPNGLILNSALNQPEDTIPETLRVKDHKGTAIIPCSLSKVKGVRVQLIQPTPYETLIAHSYQLGDVEVSMEETTWFRRTRKGLFKGGYWQEQTPEITESTNQDVRLNTVAVGDVLSTSLVQAGKKKTQTVTKVGSISNISVAYDIFKAYRYSAAIRDIEFKARSYAQSSQVVFKPIKFGRAVDAVSLYAAEIVPSSWPTGDYVIYEVSSDNINFTRIYPSSYSSTPNKAVVFNTPSETVYMKITITRPVADTFKNDSPVIDYLALSGAVHVEARS